MSDSNPVFKALTRPTMRARVTAEVLMGELVVFCLLVLWTGNLGVALFAIPVHLLNMHLIEKDKKIFRIIGNYSSHSIASVNKKIWKAWSYRP